MPSVSRNELTDTGPLRASRENVSIWQAELSITIAHRPRPQTHELPKMPPFPSISCTPRASYRYGTVPIIVSLRTLPFPMKVNEPNDLRSERRTRLFSPDIFTTLSYAALVCTIKGTYVMRDMISGEYLPLTIGQFCNILPDDGDEIVAPLQAINRENPPTRGAGRKRRGFASS